MINQGLQNLYELASPEIITVFIATLPVAELRASLPLALTIGGLEFWPAFFYSTLGNFIPAFLIVFLLGPISKWMTSQGGSLKRFIDWLFDRTKRKTSKKIQLYGEIALVLFVAIPLPFTGAWTGSIASFLFDIPPKKALPLILIGIFIAGFIVGLTTVGVKAL